MFSRARWALFLGLLMVLMAACGGADDSTTTTTTTGEATGTTAAAGGETGTTAAPTTTEVASTYPEEGTEWIIPFAAGGGADSSFRVFQKYAKEVAGVDMTVVNIEGAGGVTGWTQFLNSEPDGYTLSLATPPFNVIPAVMQPADTPYTLDQFQYMCIFANSPNALLIRETEDRFTNLEELVAFAKDNPGMLTAGASGAASPDAIHVFQFEAAAGIDLTLVAFDSGADIAQAMASGDIDLMFSDMSWQEAQAGVLKGIAVASNSPHANYPDVPTYASLGFDVIGARVRAPAAPPGTPADVIAFWEDVCKQVTEDPAFVEEMAVIGQPVQFFNAQDTTAFVQQMETGIRTIVEEQGLGG